MYKLRHILYAFTLLYVLCINIISAQSVVTLTSENFDNSIFQDGKHAFIKFYAPWYIYIHKYLYVYVYIYMRWYANMYKKIYV